MLSFYNRALLGSISIRELMKNDMFLKKFCKCKFWCIVTTNCFNNRVILSHDMFKKYWKNSQNIWFIFHHTIDESKFVTYVESHTHRSTPRMELCTRRKTIGDHDQTDMIGATEEVGIFVLIQERRRLSLIGFHPNEEDNERWRMKARFNELRDKSKMKWILIQNAERRISRKYMNVMISSSRRIKSRTRWRWIWESKRLMMIGNTKSPWKRRFWLWYHIEWNELIELIYQSLLQPIYIYIYMHC